ncbi:MAG: hypothetical protein SW833_06755 [Cyanobacteriota bacterium]|nr:hypothetical protein [Cyanobacteriota bacterium]
MEDETEKEIVEGAELKSLLDEEEDRLLKKLERCRRDRARFVGV